MIVQLARDAVQIKIKARAESPLISVYEFCYAAGLGLRIMDCPKEQARQMVTEKTFAEFKAQVRELAAQSQAFADVPDGARLKSLITGCRIRGEFSEEARQLFYMGYEGEKEYVRQT